MLGKGPAGFIDLTGLTGQNGVMTKVWPIQDAKAKFAEVVRLASSEGPQILSHRGVETAAIVSIADLQRIRQATVPVRDLLLDAPKLDEDIIEIINTRQRDTDRDFEW